MIDRDASSIIARFLGPAPAAGGPIALLGLERADLAEPAILRARDRRLDQIDRHPLAQTPEADEVRLAVHAAAATLLHPGIRARLSGRVAPASRTLEHEALLTIGMMGGWNRRALHRLTQLAHARGRTRRDIVRAVQGLVRHPDPSTPGAVAARPPASLHPEREPIDEAWRIAAAVAGSAAVMVVIAIISIVWVLPRAAPAPAPEKPSAPPPPAVGMDEYVAPARAALESAAAVTHELAGATAIAPTDPPRALERFRLATRQLAEAWPRLRPDELPPAHDGVRAVIASLPPPARDDALAHLRALAGDPDPVVSAWGAGAAALVSGADGFEHAALSRLYDAIAALAPGDDAAWGRWALALRSLPGVPEDASAAVALRTLEELTRAPNAPSRGTVRSITLACDWRGGSRARAWLLGAFGAADVPPQRLAWVTEALATESAAAGVDPTMTLPPDADIDARRALAGRYTRVWQVRAAPVADELAGSIADAITRASDGARTARTDVERVRAIAALAVANAAAELYQLAQNEQAASLLEDGALRLAAPRSESASVSLAAPPQAGQWGAGYLDLGSDLNARTQRLNELDLEFRGFGEADFAVLLDEAFRAPTRDMRDIASAAAGSLGGRPRAVLAALDMIESVPRTESSARLVEQLTGRPVWTDEPERVAELGRLALAERLLELLAGTTDEGWIDQAAGVIDWAYESAMGEDVRTDPGPAHASARVLGERWREFDPDPFAVLSDDLQPDSITRRRDRREPLARGPIERLAVEQRALVELMASRTACERPGAGPRVRTLMDTFRANDARARDAIDQVLAGELARATLWQIRLGEGPS